MNWTRVAILAAVLLLVAVSAVRADRRARWVVIWLLALPVALLMFLVALNNHYLVDLAVAVGGALVVGLGWWLIWGRKLPTPTSDAIKVWDQETEVSKKKESTLAPDPATLQAELNRLQEERDRLDVEIRRLEAAKARNNGHD